MNQYIIYIKPLLYYAYLNFYFNNIKLLKEKSINKFVMVAHPILEMQLLMEETVTMFQKIRKEFNINLHLTDIENPSM